MYYYKRFFFLFWLCENFNFKAILSSTQPEHLNRPRFSTEILRDVFHDGLFTSDYKTWSVQRKILNRSFTHKSLQHYMVFMNEHSKMLAKSYISAAEANNKTGNCCVDGDRVPELLYCYAFKTIARMFLLIVLPKKNSLQ